MAATYAAKQEAWYKEHAGAVQDGCSIAMGSYTDRQTGQVIEVGACFVAGTKIQTPDGEVNIEDIQAGDQVFACNVDTGEVGVKEVKQTFVREVNILVHVFVGEEEIITTTNHPFYVVGRGFVKAEDLRIGYTLLQLDGSTEKISRIVVENLGAPVKVYNFEVEDWHTYYVTNAGMLVHNANYKPSGSGSETTRVGRWMSREEYAKMVETGKVQMSPNGNTSYVANPADINAFGSQAKPVSIYVEFDVDSSRIYAADNYGWGQIPGPGSLYDRLNIKKGLPPIEDMPNAYNIKIGGEK